MNETINRPSQEPLGQNNIKNIESELSKVIPDDVDSENINKLIPSLNNERQKDFLNNLKNPLFVKELVDNIDDLNPILINNLILKYNKDEVVSNKDEVVSNKDEVVSNKVTADTKEVTSAENNNTYKEGIEAYKNAVEAKDKILSISKFDISKYTEEYKEQLKKQNQELNDPNNKDKLEQLAQISAVREHKQEIIDKTPPSLHKDLLDSFTALETNVSKIKELENVKTAPVPTYTKDRSLPKSSADKIKDTITTNGSVKVEGDKLVGTSLDGITKEIYSVGPEGKIQKSIQKHGYTFDVGIAPNINTDKQLEIRALNKEIDKNKETIKSRNELFTSLPEKKEGQNLFNQDHLDKLRNNQLLPNELQNSINKYSQTLGAIEGAREAQEIFGSEPTKEEKTQLENLQKTLTEIEKTVMEEFKTFYNETKTLNETTDEKTKNLNDLINDGDDQSSNNKDKQKEHEKFGFKVLDFLDNTGITAIPQSDLDTIAERINRNKGTLGLTKNFNINTFFNPIAGEPENKPFEDFINIVNKLTGLGDNGVKADANTLLNGNNKIYSQQIFKTQVKEAIYGQANGSNITNRLDIIEERLKAKNKPVEEPTEPK